MVYVVLAAVFIAIMLTVLKKSGYISNVFIKNPDIDISELSDQEILLGLDNYVISHDSLPFTSEITIDIYEQHICDLYWCDLIRLYAFSTKGEEFQSFINSLREWQWGHIIMSLNVSKQYSIAQVADDLSDFKGKINLEQSDHLLYSIRNANEQLQIHLCCYVRQNAYEENESI